MELVIFQNVQNSVQIQDAIQKLQNVFGLLDTCIWIGGRKFYQLWRRYSVSTANVLINSIQIHIWLKWTFSYLFRLERMKKSDKTAKNNKTAFLQISAVFGTH